MQLMQEIKKKLELPKLEYYETHLSLINCIIPTKMTPMEIKIMASFMSLDGEIAQFSRFGATARKLIMQQHNLSPGGLSNYTKSLIVKGLLRKTGETVEILPLLLPEDNQQLYLFKLVNTNSNGHSNN